MRNLRQEKAAGPGSGHTTLQLVRKGYKGFNIVAYSGMYHGIAEELGPVEIERLTEEQVREFALLGRWVRADSEVATMRLVDWLVTGKLRASIYPIKVPSIKFETGLDFVLLELPVRSIPMIPNGLGYVHNILRTAGIPFQTMDLNIILYHRYHSRRILRAMERVMTPSGYEMKDDPWKIANMDEWKKPAVLEYFLPDLDEALRGLSAARPKIIGISLNVLNNSIAREFIRGIRAQLQDTLVIVGGYACLYPELGPHEFPDFDYMIIGEAESTLAPLLKVLLVGERPIDLPGVLSRYDTAGRIWANGSTPQDLDRPEFPRYDWTDLDIYQTFDGHKLPPLLTSLGCRWARCRFCAECFAWRKRDSERTVEEMAWLADHGQRILHLNASDLNGDREYLLAICEHIIQSDLRVILNGQLRIDRRNDREFFEYLRTAGFANLRFGVDAWANSTLRLQCKGYTLDDIDQNLRDCHTAGIAASVNVVVGVPGETDADIQETIANICKNKPYIHLVEHINALVLGINSEYYKHPERYKIYFRGDKEEIYRKHPVWIPPELWYSEDPYTDQQVRFRRMVALCSTLDEACVPLGSYSKYMLEKLSRRK